MSAHFLVHPERRPARRTSERFRLDWREYWLFVSLLGGLLALVAVIFMASSSFR